MGSTQAWLPEGTWADIATGAVYRSRPGGEHRTLHRDERSIPALLPAGAVLPLARDADTRPDTNPDALELLLLPGADGHRELVEDDGTGTTVADIPTSRTALMWDDAAGVLTIGAATNPSVVPARRSWTVTFFGLDSLDSVTVAGGGAGAGIARTDLGWQVTVEDAPSDIELRLTVRAARGSRTADRRRLQAVLATAQWDHELKWRAWDVLESDADDVGKLAGLQAIGTPAALLSALTEVMASS